jgi:hypothetical protein
MRTRLLGGLALLLACQGALPASAVRLYEKGEDSLDLDGAFKSFFFGLHLPHHPPEVLALLGSTEKHGGFGLADARIKLEGAHQGRWKWELHYRTQALASSFPDVRGTLWTGGFARPPRWLPLETTTPDGANFEWVHEVDRLNLQVRLGPVHLIVGRQAVSFGVGFVWQPADLVATFSPLEVDREFKPGVDALRLNLALGALTELALVFAAGGPTCTRGRLPDTSACRDPEPRFSLDHSVGVARLRTTVGRVDLGGLAGWVRGDVVAGAFATAALGRFRLRSEAVLTHDPNVDLTYAGSGNPQGQSATFARAVLGLDYQFHSKRPLFVLGEIYYNGFGSLRASDYPALARRARVTEFAEVQNVGVLYLAAGLSFEPHHRLPLSLTLLANLFDPSMLVAASVTYKLADESVLEIGAYLPFGPAPARDLTVRSEFGFYPNLYFAAWKLYF